MLRDIIVKEIQDIIMSPKFVFTFLLCTILILLSIYTGINNYQSDQKEHSAAVALNQKNLENQQSWRLLASLGVIVNRKPEVLGTVVSGIQEAVGRQSRVNTAIDPTMEDSKYSTNPIFAVFGALDLSFIVKIVLSLFAILFTFDAIVGEKERGTLKLALSNRVPKDKIILGKAIGGFISLLIPLIIPLILGLLILMIYPNISLSGGDWARLGIIFVMFLLYLSVFFTLGLFVSARTSRSSTSFLLLLFIWVTFVTIIPKASIMIAGQIHPIPSVHEITGQKEAYLQEIVKESDVERTKFLKENPYPKEEADRKKWEEDIRAWAEDLQQNLTDKIDERNMAIERDYQVKKHGQQRLAVNLSRVSPASALMFSSMSLAKTGLDEHEKFLNSVKSYKPIFTKWVNTKMIENLDISGGMGPKPDISGMPRHEYVPDSLSNSVVRILPDVILMVFLIVFFFIGSYVSFIRYDVR
jgi:ABC-type transport system involved in multi-copper enzyme maturation permease subunit